MIHPDVYDDTSIPATVICTYLHVTWWLMDWLMIALYWWQNTDGIWMMMACWLFSVHMQCLFVSHVLSTVVGNCNAPWHWPYACPMPESLVQGPAHYWAHHCRRARCCWHYCITQAWKAVMDAWRWWEAEGFGGGAGNKLGGELDCWLVDLLPDWLVIIVAGIHWFTTCVILFHQHPVWGNHALIQQH